jgi:hypothetical protein
MEYKMATKTRSSMAQDAKRRALMKDIDKREAKEAGNPTLRESLTPYRGVTAKNALRKAENANINADPYGVSSNVKDSLAGRDRDLRSIEKYGDDAMRSKNFGSREPKKMAKGGKTGMRGQVKKDDMNKKAVNSAVKEAMDSIREGKINPPKEPDMGVARGSKKYQVGYGPDHPKAKSALAPETSSRPKPRPKSMEEDDYGAVDRGNRAAQLEGFNYGGKVSKMSMGGKCRGMGAATKGGSFSKNG